MENFENPKFPKKIMENVAWMNSIDIGRSKDRHELDSKPGKLTQPYQAGYSFQPMNRDVAFVHYRGTGIPGRLCSPLIGQYKYNVGLCCHLSSHLLFSG